MKFVELQYFIQHKIGFERYIRSYCSPEQKAILEDVLPFVDLTDDRTAIRYFYQMRKLGRVGEA